MCDWGCAIGSASWGSPSADQQVVAVHTPGPVCPRRRPGKAAEARPLSHIAQTRTSAQWRTTRSTLLPRACAVQARCRSHLCLSVHPC